MLTCTSRFSLSEEATNITTPSVIRVLLPFAVTPAHPNRRRLSSRLRSLSSRALRPPVDSRNQTTHRRCTSPTGAVRDAQVLYLSYRRCMRRTDSVSPPPALYTTHRCCTFRTGAVCDAQIVGAVFHRTTTASPTACG